VGFKSKKIRDAAKGRDCQIRVPGVCNGDPATVVLAHLSGGGIAGKRSDIGCASFSCSACHDAVDGRTSTAHDAATLRLYHHEGCARTTEILVNEGIVGVK
jgi:hypothetical protein